MIFMTITTWFSILFFLFSLKISVNELFFVTLKYDSSLAASEMKIQENLCQFAFSLFLFFVISCQLHSIYLNILCCSHGNFPLVFAFPLACSPVPVKVRLFFVIRMRHKFEIKASLRLSPDNKICQINTHTKHLFLFIFTLG